MNVITKTSIVGLALIAALAIAPFAQAASFTNVEFSNGQTTIEGTGGNTITANFRVVVPANEVVEQVQTDVIGDGLSPVCTSVGGTLGLEQGTHNVSLQVKLPPNTGTYNLDIQGSGIFGAFRADDCIDDVVGSASFGSALRVVGSSSGSGSSSGTGSGAFGFNSFADFVTALKAALNIGTAPTPPVVSEVCKAFAQANAGTMPNTTSAANVALQGFLLSQHISIPALAAGASFGFYGNQTTAAVGQFQAVNHCN